VRRNNSYQLPQGKTGQRMSPAKKPKA